MNFEEIHISMIGLGTSIFVRKKENYFLGRTTQRVFVSPVPTGRVGGWISVKMSGRNPVIAPGKIFRVIPVGIAWLVALDFLEQNLEQFFYIL